MKKVLIRSLYFYKHEETHLEDVLKLNISSHHLIRTLATISMTSLRSATEALGIMVEADSRAEAEEWMDDPDIL